MAYDSTNKKLYVSAADGSLGFGWCAFNIAKTFKNIFQQITSKSRRKESAWRSSL